MFKGRFRCFRQTQQISFVLNHQLETEETRSARGERGCGGWEGWGKVKGRGGHIRAAFTAAEWRIPLYTRGGQPPGLTDLKQVYSSVTERKSSFPTNHTSFHQHVYYTCYRLQILLPVKANKQAVKGRNLPEPEPLRDLIDL